LDLIPFYLSLRKRRDERGIFPVNILEPAQPEHKLRVFSGPAEIRSIFIFNQIIDKRKVDHLIDLAEQVVDGNYFVIKI
jgi:hypothetical protein